MLEDGRVSDNIVLLQQFGLTRQEAKVYLLLLTEGCLSGYEALCHHPGQEECGR